MKKIIRTLLLVSSIAACTSVLAQENRWSLGAEAGLPLGAFGETFVAGVGASARFEHPMNEKLAIIGTIGWQAFLAKDKIVNVGVDLLITKYKSSMIPIMVGGKYYFTEQQSGFYGAFEFGLVATSGTVTTILSTQTGDTSSAVSSNSTDFSYAPSIGYHLSNFDFGLRYQTISASGGSSKFLGVRIAYVFGDK